MYAAGDDQARGLTIPRMKSRPYLELVSQNRDFRRLWAAQLISFGGDWFASVALIGLTLQITKSGFYSGLILAANMLPFFLLAPVAGVVADRFDRKRLMIGADLIRMVLALGMLFVRSQGTVWIGVASLAAIAVTGSFFGPASGAALPNLVSRDQLGPANVLMGASWGTMLAVGSALGGAVAAIFGRDTAFIINSISFALSAVLIVSIRGRFSEERPHHVDVHPIRDIRDGIAYARSDRRVTALLATKGGFGLGAGVIALLPIFATDVFRGGDMAIGLLFAARGLGALFGPFAARAFVGDSQRRLFAAIGFSMAAYGVAYLAFPAMPVIWLAAAVALVAHLGGGAQWIMSSYALQRLTPDRLRGRISAFDFGLVTLTMSLSLLVAGRLAESIGPRPVMVGLAAIEISYAAIWSVATKGLWWRRLAPQVGSLDPGPLEPAPGGN